MKKKNNIVGYDIATLRVSTDVPLPPPLGFTSPFKSIHEWLSYLSEKEHPEKPVSAYHFSLVEGPLNNLLSLEGFNTYKEAGVTAHRIEFKPSQHKFFALPKEEFENLSHEQLQEQVLKELKEFFKSPDFQNSFLSKARSIRMGLAGEIWPG